MVIGIGCLWWGGIVLDMVKSILIFFPSLYFRFKVVVVIVELWISRVFYGYTSGFVEER